MKNIYFIINDVSMPGGLARVTLNLYNELTDRYRYKYSVKIITATIGNRDFILNKDIVSLGLSPLHNLRKFNKLFWYLKFIFIIQAFLKNEKPDIVIGVGVLFNLCLSLYFTKNSKIYAAEHSFYGNNNRTIIFIRKILYRRIDKIISLTEKDGIKYRKFHNDVVIIPNFTNYHNVNVVSSLENKNLLFVGRFTRTKGIDTLIEIMIKFFSKNSDWKLNVIGEGSLVNNIQNMILCHGLEKNIIIKKPTKHIDREYLNSSIYLMTSRSEAFPLVLLEAKSFGLPIISFDCNTGPSEIVKNHEDGFLIPNRDTDNFLQKLNLLTDNKKLRKNMGGKAVENVKEFYPNAIMKKWEGILDERSN